MRSRLFLWATAATLLCTSGLQGAPVRLVLPAAASIHGVNGTFFHTDLRIFNASFASPIAVQAIYHCRGGGACASVARDLTVAARQNLAVDDAVATLFEAPETGGAIEFLYDDAAGLLFVSSRLYTPQAPLPTYGGALAARRSDEAGTRTIFNQAAVSTDLASGFRTNAGGFNAGTAPMTAVFTLRSADGSSLGSASRLLGPGEFFQFDGTIADAVGLSGLTATNLYLEVDADAPFFPYAVVIDNQSGDLLFSPPGEDPAPAAPVDLLVLLSRYQFTPGGPDSPPIRLHAGVTYRLTFRATDVEHGISAIPRLGIASQAIAPGSDYVVTVTPTLSERGQYTFACTRVCGAGHGGMYGSLEVE